MMTQRTIDRYTIVKAVGRGGQGEVFHVRDQAGSEYALKWLLPHMVDRGSSDRLIREFHSIYRLDHPGVVRVHELGQWDNRPFYTMEWIDGDHLDAFIQSEHSLDVYYDILIQAFEALAYIHDHRLIHRDIKPSNIMITTDGQVKLMDFGLVKNLDASIQLTQAHKILGTLTFVSPEHLCGEPIDHRSDLYSMGIVIYRVFSRKLPFFAESLAGIVSQHLSSTPPRLIELVPSIPRDLSDLVAQLLKKAPWERPSSARFVADSLRTISRQTYRPTREITASDTHVHYRLQPRFSGRKPERDRLIKDLTANERFSIQIISGQHGIGKTRLLTESLKESLVQGLSRVIIRSNVGRHLADSGQKSLFHQIAGQIERHLTVLDDFRGLLPELAPLHPAFSQFEATRNETTQRFDPSSRKFTVRYLSAVVGHLTRIQPWLIIWDDLQTADAFQLEFIRD
ncbi:protein kinase, partial [bacterium]|nr:protein kinase [candidate division CSSED10-310 bacterium]